MSNMNHKPQSGAVEDIRNTNRFRIKVYLLYILFPLRVILCLVLAVLSYQHWEDVYQKHEKEIAGDSKNATTYETYATQWDVNSNLITTVLFALVICSMNLCGWWGVIYKNWSMACAYNAVGMILLMIDLYLSFFDIPYHIAGLVLTIIILIFNILFSCDLDSVRKYQNMILRARIEEADRKAKYLPHQYKSIDLGE